jgi:hypothetical protein
MKTPEELARDYCEPILSDEYAKAIGREDWIGTRCVFVGEGHEMYKAYLAGYQAAAPQWISVKDRLPEEDVAVLVYGQVLNDPPDVIGVRRRYNGDQEWKYTWESEDGFIYREDDVTHWMPLPKPPEE